MMAIWEGEGRELSFLGEGGFWGTRREARVEGGMRWRVGVGVVVDIFGDFRIWIVEGCYDWRCGRLVARFEVGDFNPSTQ